MKMTILLFLIGLTAFSCEENNEIDSLEKIEVYQIDWHYHPRYRLDIKDVREGRRGYERSLIESTERMRRIIDQLDQLQPLPDFKDVNVRMYCVIKNSVGEVDTLSVGYPQIYKYRGVVYDKDSVLLNLIVGE